MWLALPASVILDSDTRSFLLTSRASHQMKSDDAMMRELTIKDIRPTNRTSAVLQLLNENVFMLCLHGRGREEVGRRWRWN